MEVHFRTNRLNLQNLEEFDAIVCPDKNSCSATKYQDELIRELAGSELKTALPGRELNPIEVYITPGFELGTDFIAHVNVPEQPEYDDFEELFITYNRILTALGRTDIAGQHPKSAAITLLGTDSNGWSYKKSLHDLWLAIIEYHKHYRSFGSLEHLYVYLPEDMSCSIIEEYSQRASQAFFSRPAEWGARLGIGLWYDLMEHFDNPKFNNIPISKFIQEVQRFFHQKTGQWLCGNTQVSLAEWARSSSGVVSSIFAEIAVPVLCHNLCKLGFPATGDSVSFVIPVTLREYQLNLPYEILPDLVAMRKKADELTEKQSILLVPGRPYYLTKYHYRGAPELIDHYSLDVEKANDSHYSFRPEAAAEICKQLGYMPVALGAALCTCLKEQGEGALEALVSRYSYESFHY